VWTATEVQQNVGQPHHHPPAPIIRGTNEHVHPERTHLPERAAHRPAGHGRPQRRPHVVPTGFNIDGEKGVGKIGGHIHPDRGQKRLYLTNLASNPNAALVIDDLVIDPWTSRAVTVGGKALITPKEENGSDVVSVRSG
jgi:hypothetical protein